VQVERFARELPGLFEDFPSSAQPLGRRFDDVLDRLPSYASENTLALLNLAASLLEPGESYVEVGSYHGASLVAAMRGNDGDFVGIDDFSYGGTSRRRLRRNLERFDVGGATILDGDAFEVLGRDTLAPRRAGVFYLDAAHDYEDQLRLLEAAEPWLAGTALVVVDDTDWEQVARAVEVYLTRQPRARRLFRIDGKAAGAPQWWHGVEVLGWGR
jgi:predicted O-methyltransferase YrrM